MTINDLKTLNGVEHDFILITDTHELLVLITEICDSDKENQEIEDINQMGGMFIRIEYASLF